MYIKSFKELIVWQRSMELAEAVYRIANELPQEEVFNLKNQLKRAAISIPSNIAEGRQRKTRKDFIQFLRIADGSLAEIETQLLIVNRLYTKVETTYACHLLQEVQKMLATMIKRLKIES